MDEADGRAERRKTTARGRLPKSDPPFTGTIVFWKIETDSPTPTSASKSPRTWHPARHHPRLGRRQHTRGSVDDRILNGDNSMKTATFLGPGSPDDASLRVEHAEKGGALGPIAVQS
jgi:hypothetical protein